MKTLKNRDPPLVQDWSNPKKFRLTTEGKAEAAECYLEAVQAGKLRPHPRIALPGLGAVGGAGAGAGAGAVPVPPILAPASQQYQQHQQERRNSGMFAGPRLSQGADPRAAAAAAAMARVGGPLAAAPLAVPVVGAKRPGLDALIDMGYPEKRARKSLDLAEGDLEAALDLIDDIASDDEPAPGARGGAAARGGAGAAAAGVGAGAGAGWGGIGAVAAVNYEEEDDLLLGANPAFALQAVRLWVVFTAPRVFFWGIFRCHLMIVFIPISLL
jgi:hypothetical protein